MVQILSWLLTVLSVICLCQNCYGNYNDSRKEEDCKAFGYELVQVQLDYVMNSQNQISKELTQVKDTTREMSKIIVEKQNAMMEKLWNQAADKQTKLMEQLTGGLLKIADNTNQNKISNELAQIKDGLAQLKDTISGSAKLTVDKQTTMMERLLTIANSTNRILDRKMGQQNQEIQSCKSAGSTGLYRLICDYCPPDTSAYCEMGSFGGGWLVIQQRLDGSEYFARNWSEYRNGFGNVGKSSEFWLGLELIHQISNRGDYELAIELKHENGTYGFARYSDFKIAEEKEKYRMTHLGSYRGTIGDQLSYHRDMKFSTYDQDNDARDSENCSKLWYSNGGWWYKNCADSALNGAYNENTSGFGIRWAGFSVAAKFSRMMIRQK